MTIENDIKQALIDVGVAYTVYRDSGNLSGEYLKAIPNRQVTKPFIREFFIEAQLPHDTSAGTGDVIEFDITDERYLLMNKTPTVFENTTIRNEGVLHKCNVSGELRRPSGEVWDTQTYHKVQQWEVVDATCYALFTEPMFGHDLETDEQLALIGLSRHEMYVPASVGVQVLDRFEPVSGEYYRVETIKTRRFPNIDVVELAQDTR